MTWCLFWREKVVLSLTIGAILFFITSAGFSQTVVKKYPENLTFSIHGLQLPEAIRQLEKITGLHFIYSSNKIPGRSRITLAITDGSLEEVLALLEDQTNLSFKRQEQYVVIKAGNENLVSKEQQQIQRLPEGRKFNYGLTLADSGILHASAKKHTYENLSLVFSRQPFRNQLKDVGMYFDTIRLKQLPREEVRQLNVKNRHRGWFISGGVRLSEYLAGAEFQAGLRSLYVIYSPGIMKGGRYHGAYGLGTSFLLKNNLSVNPAYTYFTFQQKANYSVMMNPESHFSQIDLAFTAKHHQIKLMVQYAFNENLQLRLGPVINSLVTTYQLPEKGLFRTYSDRPVSIPPTGGSSGATTSNYPSMAAEVTVVKGITQYPPQTLRLWVNWEASFSYKLNFFKRP
jgi:hypothetical protein